MKVAIASSGEKLTAMVDPRFGRCPCFLIVDSKSGKFEVLENTATAAFRGAGISAAQIIADQKVEAVIAGNFGPNAVNVLQASGIKLFSVGVEVSVQEAVDQLEKGSLEEITAATAPFGRGGGGFGRGRKFNGSKKQT